MRPRKKILLVSESEDRILLLRFLLDVHGYMVSGTNSLADAIEDLSREQFDLLLIDLPFSGAETLLDEARKGTVQVRTLALARKFTSPMARLNPDCFLVEKRDNSDLLERVRVLTSRKRVPKPHKPVQGEPKISAENRRIV